MLTKLWVFPVGVSLLIPGTFFLTYSIAVLNGHVQPFIPYISDTGSYPPESCIFAQLLNFSALLVGLVMYLRHRQVVEFYRHACQSQQRFINCSTIFLWIGYISAFGISMVGNFQQTAWLLAHMLGAFLAFGFGLVYCWGQTVFTYRMEPVLHKPFTCHLRLALACVATTCFFLMSGFGFNPLHEITPQRAVSYNDCALWQLVFIAPGDQGYAEHTVTTACEWIMVLVFVVYFATYAMELRHSLLLPPKLVLMIEHAKLPKDDGYTCTSMSVLSPEAIMAIQRANGGNMHFPNIQSKMGAVEVFTVGGEQNFGLQLKGKNPV